MKRTRRLPLAYGPRLHELFHSGFDTHRIAAMYQASEASIYNTLAEFKGQTDGQASQDFQGHNGRQGREAWPSRVRE